MHKPKAICPTNLKLGVYSKTENIKHAQYYLDRFIYINYRKFPKYSDSQNICWNHSKILTMWLYHRVMSPNDADGMANSVDPDQTAPLGAVWSGSALFAQAYLSENLGSLRYISREMIIAPSNNYDRSKFFTKIVYNLWIKNALACKIHNLSHRLTIHEYVRFRSDANR